MNRNRNSELLVKICTCAMMAAVVVISLPLIVIFLLFRNKIMAGVSRGGTKG